MKREWTLLGAALLLSCVLAAETVDRIAVVVGKTVITESEVDDALRITAFLNGEPVDLSPAKRRAAAERLVDQELLRKEMEASRFAMPSPTEVDATYQQFLRNRFHSAAADRAQLQKYGITAEELKQQLGWQLALLRFTDFRFRNDLAAPTDGNQSRNNSADRLAPAAESVDQRMEDWLKDARQNTKVVLKPEAFQ